MESLYQEQPVSDRNPLIWLLDLEMGLGIWQGIFDEVPGFWLRWCGPQSGSVSDRQGHWLFTDTEQAEQEAEQERLAKEQAQKQLLQAAQNLMATGMKIEQVAGLLNLSAEQMQQINGDRF